MPNAVLQKAASEMLNWQGSGMGVMEMSHRGKEFTRIMAQTLSDLRTLLAIPAHFQVLFMQGGGMGQNAIVPLNLSKGGAVDFVVTGTWSQKSSHEALRYCDAQVVASSAPSQFCDLPAPSTWALRSNAQYVHLCTNETIHGVEMHALPDLAALGSDAPLVVDCSSHIASRPMDWDKIGLAFAGAQKNLGPAGLTVVVVRDDLLDRALPVCPSAFNYRMQADNGSMLNTPPTYAIYMAGLVFEWLLTQGGVAAMEQLAITKAQKLYDAIDRSDVFYNPVARHCRSRMNVPFFIHDSAGGQKATEVFLSGAAARGLLQLKGHKALGGLRASLYNAMPMEGVNALVDYMSEFERQGGLV